MIFQYFCFWNWWKMIIQFLISYRREEMNNFDDNKASYTTTYHHITHSLSIFRIFSRENLETNLNADVS